jgi:hypothetical protein
MHLFDSPYVLFCFASKLVLIYGSWWKLCRELDKSDRRQIYFIGFGPSSRKFDLVKVNCSHGMLLNVEETIHQATNIDMTNSIQKQWAG